MGEECLKYLTIKFTADQGANVLSWTSGKIYDRFSLFFPRFQVLQTRKHTHTHVGPRCYSQESSLSLSFVLATNQPFSSKKERMKGKAVPISSCCCCRWLLCRSCCYLCPIYYTLYALYSFIRTKNGKGRRGSRRTGSFACKFIFHA